MAFSGNIGLATFNALKVVDSAFRRCRIPPQVVTSEMQNYALDSLSFLLSEISNSRTPSWCIEKVILPLYQNQPVVTLPLGTVEVLNANYRILQTLTGTTTSTTTSYTVDFGDPTVVNTVGVKWSGASVALTFEVSANGSSWTSVGTSDVAAVSGDITWTDIDAALAYQYFRITSAGTINYSQITLGNMPQEIPLGTLNRDTYVQQSNKVFPSRPNSYWFQRDIPNPVMHIWPAPYAAAEQAQLIVWRHRYIMDTDNLQQEVEIPQRWLNAIITRLAFHLAMQTAEADPSLVPVLKTLADEAIQKAVDGDTDGSPTYINPGIGCYTK